MRAQSTRNHTVEEMFVVGVLGKYGLVGENSTKCFHGIFYCFLLAGMLLSKIEMNREV